jgi:carbamoyl-phosphate synthase small subunit
VDVRALVKKIREAGVMMGLITTEHTLEKGLEILRAVPDYDAGTYAREVSTPRAYQWQSGGGAQSTPGTQWEMPLDAAGRVVVLDYGTKFNILRSLRERDLEVVVLPYNATPEEVLAWKPDGVMLSNGPGDPRSLQLEVDNIRELLDLKPELPIFGICLGHQLLGRAFGGETFKLKFGHRGANHPVKDLKTGKVHITSQNHGYAIDASTLSDEVEVTHINLNDNTVEGLRHKTRPVFCVQYHPEASPGPKDNAHLFDEFAESVKKK